MTWFVRIACLGESTDEMEVARLAAPLAAALDEHHPRAPMVRDLARGKWDLRMQVLLWQRALKLNESTLELEGPFEAMMALTATAQTGVTTIACVAADKDLAPAEVETLLDSALSHLYWHSLVEKCPRLEWDATVTTLPLDQMLVRLGNKPGDQPGIWLAQPQPERMLEEARQFNKGKGSWHVVVHNDDVTPMDVVASTLEHGAGLNTELAWQLTLAIHNLERVIVSAHGFRWMAERMRRRLAAMFKRYGYATRVEVQAAPPAA